MSALAAAPFPDANLLLLPGRGAALVDSGFVSHAEVAAACLAIILRHLRAGAAVDGGLKDASDSIPE